MMQESNRDTRMMMAHMHGEETSYHPVERLCRLCPGFDAHYEALIEIEKRAQYCAREAEPSGSGEQEYAEWILQGGEYPSE